MGAHASSVRLGRQHGRERARNERRQVRSAHTRIGQNSEESAKPQRKTDVIAIVGRVASVLSVCMYVSYIPQIMNNLAGSPGSPWQPLAAFFNCVMWTIYGLFKKDRDWPIVIANVPGIFLGATAFLTAIFNG